MTDNLQMGVRTRRLARAVLGCAAICAAASARADDYVLAAGETDALAFAGGTVTNFTSMTVAGDLEITGDGWIKTPTLNLDGGTLTVDGTKASIGTAHYQNETPTTLTFTNAADGTYGKVIVKNGTPAAQNDYRYNFGAKYFNVATNAPEVTGTDGYLDVLSVDSAGIAIREAKNYSTLTARISVAGTSLLSRGGGYAYGAGIFMRGAFAIDLKEGSVLTISTGNQLGAFNSANVPVVVGGTGDLVFSHVSNETQPYYQMFNKGAMLNNVGNLSFSGASGANGGVFGFEGHNIIGPNVRTIRPTGYYKVALRVAHPYTVMVHDLDFVRSGYDDRLFGDGDATIRIDASSSPCAFRANIPPFYVLKQSSVTSTNENSLAVEKIGSYEATISSTTNIPTLNVLEVLDDEHPDAERAGRRRPHHVGLRNLEHLRRIQRYVDRGRMPRVDHRRGAVEGTCARNGQRRRVREGGYRPYRRIRSGHDQRRTACGEWFGGVLEVRFRAEVLALDVYQGLQRPETASYRTLLAFRYGRPKCRAGAAGTELCGTDGDTRRGKGEMALRRLHQPGLEGGRAGLAGPSSGGTVFSHELQPIPEQLRVPVVAGDRSGKPRLASWVRTPIEVDRKTADRLQLHAGVE